MIQALLKNKWVGALLIACNTSFACDFCSLLDYGNLTNQTSVRLDYKFRNYSGYNGDIGFNQLSSATARQGIGLHRAIPGVDKTYINHPDDYERYIEYNLGFIYNRNNKTNYVLNIPYVQNTDYYGLVIPDIGPGTAEKNEYSGFGDMKVGIQKIYTKEKETFKHTFKLSGLLNLPTGKYQVNDLFGENIHMQPGRSIYAADLGANYTFENLGLWGFYVNSNLYLPFKNNAFRRTYSYTFAKVLKTNLQVFKTFEGELKKVLFLGLSHEYRGQEYVNNYEIYDTGAQLLAASLGTTLKYKRTLITANYEIPLVQKLNGLQLKTNRAFNISCMWYLPNKKEK